VAVPRATLQSVSRAGRNALIVVAIAAAVFAVPGGGDAAQLVGAVMSTLITVAFVSLGWRIYREHRVDLHSLGDEYRGALYAALAAIVFALAGVSHMMDTGAGTLVWFIVVGLAVWALFRVFFRWREQNTY
jgi:hypothetical protein